VLARPPDFSEDLMPLQGLIFDVDGTLAETEEVHRQAFNEAFAAFGLPWKWERPLYKELLQVSGGKERILHYLTKWHAQDLAAVREKIPAIYDFKTKQYTAAIRAGAVELKPGVARLIGEARAAGARLAIATTSHRDNVEALLQHTFARARRSAIRCHRGRRRGQREKTRSGSVRGRAAQTSIACCKLRCV